MSDHERRVGDRDEEIQRLFRNRPRSRFKRYSGVALTVLVMASWANRDLWPGGFFTERRMANFERFLGELRPYPLHGKAFDFGVAASWAGDIWNEKGAAAVSVTLAMSVAAIVLAALWALALTFTAARTLATAEPYLPGPSPPSKVHSRLWRLVLALTRVLLVFIRALPEYVWAFLFLAVLGPTAWPVVLALALHNAGILGKLTAEIVENLEPAPLEALRSVGAGRLQITLAGIFPLILPRFLLFFFYRWETCVREATVLGMLGIVSLGYWIVDTRARNHYDEMFFFVLLGAGIVLVGDLVSAVAREVVRRAA